MLGFFVLIGLATAMAAPVVVSSISDDDANDDLTEPESAVSTDPAQGDPNGMPSSPDMLDEFESTEQGFDEPISPVLSPTEGDVRDIPSKDSADLEEITPLLPIHPEMTDSPPDGSDLPVDEILQPEEDPDPSTAEVLQLVTNLDDSVDEIEGPDNIANIQNFVPGEDVLEITIFTTLPPEGVTVEVAISEDGQDSLVTANDQLIAILRDLPDAEPIDFLLNTQSPLAS